MELRVIARLLIVVAAAVFSLAAAGAAASGCFSTPTPNCAYLCGTEGQCPDGYFCATDGACKREGLVDGFDCGFRAPPDAGLPIDAAPADAAIDAALDAALDAAIDAS